MKKYTLILCIMLSVSAIAADGFLDFVGIGSKEEVKSLARDVNNTSIRVNEMFNEQSKTRDITDKNSEKIAELTTKIDILEKSQSQLSTELASVKRVLDDILLKIEKRQESNVSR